MTDDAAVQQQVFDLDAARGARNEALDRVEGNAEQTWWDHATAVVTKLAYDGRKFTTDDVWAELAQRGVEAPHEGRALGAVMRALGRVKVIEPTTEYVNSVRVSCHCRPVRVWVGGEGIDF